MVTGLELQIPDGVRVARAAMNDAPDAGFAGPGRLTTISAFAPVSEAIAAWIAAADAGDMPEALAASPLHGPKAMASLFRALGLPARTWCCDSDRPLPGIAVDEVTAVPDLAVADDSGLVGAFQRHCATCHRTELSFPPNFLAGDRGRIEANLRACAPRMAYRLAMWSRDAKARVRSPMPPAQAVARQGMTPEQWRESADYKALRTFVDSLLAVGGHAPVEASDARDYASLPACVADGDGSARQ
jgi:hypothetical protein